jgi:hypothetical protein
MEMMEVAVFPSGCKMFWGVPEKGDQDCFICRKAQAEFSFRYDGASIYATRCRVCVKIFFEKLPDAMKEIGLRALEAL